MTMATLLTPDQLAAGLASLNGWTGDLSGISRTVAVDPSARDQLFIELERVAREMDHDPDLSETGADLTIKMSTHSAGGVTELDIAYAQRFDALIKSRSSSA
jgi:4a-hydroxytetrahydrobiopterin dehydratase